MAYTQLASGNWGTGPQIPYTFYYEKSRSNSNMIYKIKVVLGAVTGASYFGYAINCNIDCGGVTTSTQMKAVSPSQWSSDIIYETSSLTVNNKISGTTALTIKLTGVDAPRGSTNFTYSLPIDPAVSTISCPGGDIGSATSIQITKYNSTFTNTVHYWFGSAEGDIAVKTSNTSISWTIPTSFYAIIPSNPSGTGTLRCTTYNGNTSVGYDEITFTATVNKENSKPTLSPTIQDSNSVTYALTGSHNRVVKGHSNMAVTSGASARNGSSITSQKITCGDAVINSGSGTFTGAQSATFVFTATDSRDYSTSQTVTKTLVDYLKPTCVLTTTAITASGTATLNISGKYFNGSFGSQSNTLTVQYRYKTAGGSYGSWTNATATKTNNDYTATVNLAGLNYRNTYTFQARATDKLYSEVLSAEITKRSIPQFDWGADDFNFNVDLEFNNGEQLEERSIKFANSTGTNPHECCLYGGNPDSTTGIGLFDVLNSREILRYNDTGSGSLYLMGVNITGRFVNEFSSIGINDLANTPTGYSGYGRCLRWGTASSSDKYFILIDSNNKLYSGIQLNSASSITWAQAGGGATMASGTCTLNDDTATSVSFGKTFSSVPSVVLTAKTTATGIIAAKVNSVTTTGFTAIIGGTVAGNIDFSWIAML